MSGPVPSPSMNGMTGLAGTRSRPSFMVIGSPSAGAWGREVGRWRAWLDSFQDCILSEAKEA